MTDRWRHKKRGTIYTIVGEAISQASSGDIHDNEPVLIYRGEDGQLWVRPIFEFHDGRFERVEDAASPSPASEDVKCAVYSVVPPYRTKCEPCLIAGVCIYGMRARLSAKIAEQDQERGQPLTNRERLSNLRKAMQEIDPSPASEDVERAREFLSWNYMCHTPIAQRVKDLAAALSAAREQARAEERERCAQRVERTGWPNCGDTAALIRAAPPQRRDQ